MKKRGQVMGTPFIMIFALIVGAMVLIGGIYYVSKLISMAQQVSIGKEVNSFQSTVSTYYQYEEGNKKRLKISLPKATHICFFDSDKYREEGWRPAGGAAAKHYPLHLETFSEEFLRAFTEENMLVFPTEKFKDSTFKINYLTLEEQDNNPICIRNGGYVWIISMGDHVEVKAEYTTP